MFWIYVLWGNKNKTYVLRGNKNKTRPFLHIILSIKDSLQQQIHYNGNIFGNKYCRCNEGSLYSYVDGVPNHHVIIIYGYSTELTDRWLEHLRTHLHV